jgi:hypothetical protein
MTIKYFILVIYRRLRKLRHLRQTLTQIIIGILAKNDKFTEYFYLNRRSLLSKTILESTLNEAAKINQSELYLQVKKGPFSGLIYSIGKSEWYDDSTSLVQKMYGLYEQEILNYISSHRWSTLIDIGAGTGYYSFGMLKAGLCTKSVLFESDKTINQKIPKMANINNISSDRYIIHNSANESEIMLYLDSLAETSKVLIICDIEGYENVLFNSKFLKKLSEKNVTLVIEIHKHKFYKYQSKESFLVNLSYTFIVKPLHSMKRNLDNTLDTFNLITDRWLFASENRGEGVQLVAYTNHNKEKLAL